MANKRKSHDWPAHSDHSVCAAQTLKPRKRAQVEAFGADRRQRRRLRIGLSAERARSAREGRTPVDLAVADFAEGLAEGIAKRRALRRDGRLAYVGEQVLVELVPARVWSFEKASRDAQRRRGGDGEKSCRV